MRHVFLVSSRPSLASALGRFLKDARKLDFTWLSPDPPMDKQVEGAEVLEAFRRVAGRLDPTPAGDPRQLRSAVVVLDFADPDLGTLGEMSPLAGRGWGAVAAMLVLAYPEVHFAFLTPHGASFEGLAADAHVISGPESFSRLAQLADEQFTPLFDPTNVRGAILSALRLGAPASEGDLNVPVRPEPAAAVDDEEPYAYFEAYVAYRFGFRVHLVRSYRMMDRLFTSPRGADSPYCLFEDLYLNFPDRPPGTPALSDLPARDQGFPRLTPRHHRIIVTSGPHGRDDRQKVLDNKSYLWSLRMAGCRSKWLYKPVSGVYDLWHNAGLAGHLPQGRAPGYVWPPPSPRGQGRLVPHSAPGRLLEVAERLIRRADMIREKAASVPDAVHGAILALTAKELLGGRTPPTSAEALSLQHQLEIAAECMFYGVEYNFDVRRRFRDLRDEVVAGGDWYQPSTRARSERNTRANILNRLVPVFKKYGQFEEELACLNEARLLQWPLWPSPLRHYLGRLVGSFPLILLASALWIFLYSVGYYLADPSLGFGEWLVKSGETFLPVDVTGQYPQTPGFRLGLGWRVARASEVLLGFIHLGLFASRLFLLLIRR